MSGKGELCYNLLTQTCEICQTSPPMALQKSEKGTTADQCLDDTCTAASSTECERMTCQGKSPGIDLTECLTHCVVKCEKTCADDSFKQKCSTACTKCLDVFYSQRVGGCRLDKDMKNAGNPHSDYQHAPVLN